jgi:mRNA interferase RelE/StbE
VAYEVLFRAEAREAFDKLDPAVRQQVGRAIDRLEQNPRPRQATPIVGEPGALRIRTGAWRVIYEIHEGKLVVLVLDVGHRSTVYRSRR